MDGQRMIKVTSEGCLLLLHLMVSIKSYCPVDRATKFNENVYIVLLCYA